MSYWVTRFGDKDLPRCNAVQDNGMPDIAPAYSQFPYGGVFDAYGSDQGRVSLPFPIPVEGTIHFGDMQAEELYAWRALHGVRSTLYRRRDDGAEEESITARLMRLSTMRSYANPEVLELRFQFDALEEFWAGQAHSVVTALDASPKSIVVDNDGNAIQRNIVLTVTAAGSAVTMVQVGISGISLWQWDGTLAIGNSLVVDVGARTIRNNGVDAYVGFALDPLHTIAEWLRLQPGANTIQIWRTGGDATTSSTVAYRDAWA